MAFIHSLTLENNNGNPRSVKLVKETERVRPGIPSEELAVREEKSMGRG